MHRIDHATAVAVQPAPAPTGTPGYFTEGNPSLGAEATVVTGDWANAVQEEIANVIEEAGDELDKADNTQLVTAILALIAAHGGSVSAATTTVAGIVELATSAETAAGTDGTRAVTPASAVATFCKRANNLSDLNNAATARNNLGLGTAATVNTGTAAGNVPLVSQADARYARLATANTFTGEQTAPSFNSTSSRRYKTGIETIDADEALRLLAGVRWARYRMRADGSEAAGVIAEELADGPLDFVVKRTAGGEPEAVNYQPLFSIAMAALQGLAQRVAHLEAAFGAGGA